MTLRELAELVLAMRNAQKEYFRTRTGDALEASKRLERIVDNAVREALLRERQAELFGE